MYLFVTDDVTGSSSTSEFSGSLIFFSETKTCFSVTGKKAASELFLAATSQRFCEQGVSISCS